MKTILVTAYAINPYKGSEDGMGWNLVMQIARYQKVIAVTRINNASAIERYQLENPTQQHLFDHITFKYFDWPYWLRFWKKGPMLSLIYFYGWQLTLACWLMSKKLKVDVVHNLNFHNDWTPSFLWLLRKPLVWGPIGHHPVIPALFIKPVYGTRAFSADRILGFTKKFFWKLDPFLQLTKRYASTIICMNSEVPIAAKYREKMVIMPSVASEAIPVVIPKQTGEFTILSVGRFVPLKGFDITIKAFSLFYSSLSDSDKKKVRLILVGSGPTLLLLTKMIIKEGIGDVVQVIEWLPREQLGDIYQKANLFFFPSHEGAGMVVSEAMSYGLPVLCFNNSGPGEFVHPASELKVNYGNYENTIYNFSQKLDMLFNNHTFYSIEKKLALQRFHDNFRWKIRGEQLKDIYDQLENTTNIL